jgi:hypothetical protein
MNIQLTLDYQTILRNESRPVHLVAKLTAQKMETNARSRSAAFAVVLDRSSSMSGKPLQLARESCAAVVRNLRPNDFFSLVVFDDSAQVVIPLRKPSDRRGMLAAIAGISEAGSTNLMAGWLLGRDELLKSLAAPQLTGEAQDLLDETRRKVDSGNLTPRDLKNLVSESRTRTRTTTRSLGGVPRKISKPRAKPTDEQQARSPEK